MFIILTIIYYIIQMKLLPDKYVMIHIRFYSYAKFALLKLANKTSVDQINLSFNLNVQKLINSLSIGCEV